MLYPNSANEITAVTVKYISDGAISIEEQGMMDLKRILILLSMLLVGTLFFAPLSAISQEKGATEEVEVLFVQDAQ